MWRSNNFFFTLDLLIIFLFTHNKKSGIIREIDCVRMWRVIAASVASFSINDFTKIYS